MEIVSMTREEARLLNGTGFYPMWDFILVLKEKVKEVETELSKRAKVAGLVLPDDKSKVRLPKNCEGVVVNIGCDVNGGITEGMHIIFAEYAGVELKDLPCSHGENYVYHLMRETDVMMVKPDSYDSYRKSFIDNKA